MWLERRTRFLFSGILLFSIFVGQTKQQQQQQQQREIKSKWDNRLLPTNSVYEQPVEFVPSSGKVPSSSNENVNNEEIYDEDYELDEKSAEREKFSLENSSISHEIEYDYYYDDYGNATSSEHHAAERGPVDYFDSAEEEHASSETRRKTLKASMEEDSNVNSTKERHSDEKRMPISEKLTASREDERTDEKSSINFDGEIVIGGSVVSVVTTKSVVNGTISVPVGPLPMTTEQILSPIIPSSTANPMSRSSSEMDEDPTETTEDSRIVASVQTSRSISGARFLPFLVLENSDNENSENSSEKNVKKELLEKIDDNYDTRSTTTTTTATTTTTTKKAQISSESTESIIDKLDQFQSDLSSGLLANGFHTSGNNLQLEVLGERRTNRKSYTTTSRTPIISKFVPKRYQDRQISTTEKIFEFSRADETSGSTEKIKFRWPSSSRNTRTSTTESSSTLRNLNKTNNRGIGPISRAPVATSGSPVQDISAFLPPGYKLKKEDTEVTEKSILSEILKKSKIDISGLLPVNYKPPEGQPKIKEETKISTSTNLDNLFEKSELDLSSLLPADYAKSEDKMAAEERTSSTTIKPTKKSLDHLFEKASVDLSGLLPQGYNRFKNLDALKEEATTTTETTREMSTSPTTLVTTPRAVGPIKLVFPSRPGGRKASAKTTTPAHSARQEGSRPVTPRIQKGWPTRVTTEFTGWPTPSTTPISIEKLLEAARTATVASINVSMIPTTQTSSTTSTSTTTTTTPRPTTPGICEEECEVAGTIRIVGNATWVPELLDRNTQEWQLLAEEIEKEMNLVFAKSSALGKWYKRVRIDAFSPGSILVDYFVELADLSQRINTQELKVIFHDALRTYNSDKWNETRAQDPIQFGAFVLDPKSTDFVVIPKANYPQRIETDDRLIPQWAIAVIVIGVGGLLFTIVFGVSVLINRQNAAKSKPSPVVYTEEVAKTIIQTNHGAPSHRSSHDYPKSEISTIWNDTDVWRDKSFESNSNEVLIDGTLGRERKAERRSNDDRKYNMYDSWRSEWNGYYYNPSHSSKFAGYESTTNLSHHPPDYDTNF